MLIIAFSKDLVNGYNFSSVLHAHEDVHHVVQHHGHPVVEEGLPENQVVEVRVYPDLNGFRPCWQILTCICLIICGPTSNYNGKEDTPLQKQPRRPQDQLPR